MINADAGLPDLHRRLAAAPDQLFHLQVFCYPHPAVSSSQIIPDGSVNYFTMEYSMEIKNITPYHGRFYG